jgi:hypothetical protein
LIRGRWIAGIGVAWLGAAVLLAAGGQAQPEPGQSVSVSGVLGFRVIEDFGSASPGVTQVFVTDSSGQEVAVRPPAGGIALSSLAGQAVTVSGQRRSDGAVDAQAIFRDVPLKSDIRAAVSGSYPFANVMCKFSDSAGVEPNPPSFYGPLVDNTFPHLDHYWRASSFDMANLAGSANTSAWVTLPQPRSHYIKSETEPTSNLYGPLAQDCITAAESLLNVPAFAGLNMFFNVTLGCCSVGGGMTLTADGQSKFYRVTWMNPAHTSVAGVLAHEIGHNFGFPHSSGPYGQTYDSQWDVMSSPSGRCVQNDAAFGCIPEHTIALHRDMAGWIPTARKFVAPAGALSTIVLSEVGGGSSAGYLMAQVALSGTTHLMTIETRRQSNAYDVNAPGDAVVIHLVNLTAFNSGDLNTPAAIVVDPDGNGNTNDAGAQWTAGETYTNATYGVTVSIVSADASSATVTIDTRSQVGTPPSVVTHPVSQSVQTGDTASVSVSAIGAPPLSYQWYRRNSVGTNAQIAGATSTSYTTGALTATERLFARVTNSAGSSDSNIATIGVSFTDASLAVGSSVVKTTHIAELRTRIASLRSEAGLSVFSWSDPTLTPAGAVIRAVHIVELRTALAAVYAARGLTAPGYTDGAALTNVGIKLVHVTELRSAVTAIE